MVAAVATSPVAIAPSSVAANRAIWARAYQRAVAEGLTATINADGLSWKVKNYTLIEYWTAGGSWRDVVCNCKAGQGAVPCKHAAILIKTLSLGSTPLGRDVPVPAAVPATVAAVPASPWAGLAVADLLAMKGGDPTPPPAAAAPAKKTYQPRPIAPRRQPASPAALEQGRIARAMRLERATARDEARACEAQIAAQADPDCDQYESFADYING